MAEGAGLGMLIVAIVSLDFFSLILVYIDVLEKPIIYRGCSGYLISLLEQIFKSDI